MTTFDRLPLERLRYGAVVNDLPASTQLPIEISGWKLDWATADELNEIVPEFRAYASPHLGAPHQEMTLVPQGDGVRYESATRDAWRYCVVRRTPDAALPAYKLAEALRISEAELWVETWMASSREGSEAQHPGMGGRPGAVGQYFADWFSRPLLPPALPVENLVEVVRLRAELDDEKFEGIARTLALFRDLDVVTEGSPAKVLGYFSILESLLAHAPQPTDPVDSITRQLKRNLVLVDHRLPTGMKLPLSSFTDITGASQVIGKLYSVRSAYAHGDAGDSTLKWLEDRRPPELQDTGSWLPNLMRQMTRRVLQAALREPQLVTDLRGAF